MSADSSLCSRPCLSCCLGAPVNHIGDDHCEAINDGNKFDIDPSLMGLSKFAACRRDAAEATRKRLDDAAKLKAQEEREKAAQKHQRQEYK